MRQVAFIFPGQGAQEVGMGREFYESSPAAKTIFDQANAIIKDLTSVIFDGPPEKLTSTAFCQPAIFTVCAAALKAFEAHPKFKTIDPQFACGLSLGEYPALVACGALSFEEAKRLFYEGSDNGKHFMNTTYRIKKYIKSFLFSWHIQHKSMNV